MSYCESDQVTIFKSMFVFSPIHHTALIHQLKYVNSESKTRVPNTPQTHSSYLKLIFIGNYRKLMEITHFSVCIFSTQSSFNRLI